MKLGSIVLFLLCVLIGFNVFDAAVAKRPLLAQLRADTVLTAPLNAIVHVGTPTWLKKRLARSPILKPTPELFPSLERLRAAFPIIHHEALEALRESKPIKHDLYFQGIADDGWKRFYIKWYGPTDPLAKRVCPQTAALLESMPEVHLGMFSILMPGSKIPPHFGPARMCLRYHMGISTPNHDSCGIHVGNHSYSWKDGEDVMFDDTIRHSVQNLSDKPRIILFLDIERPQHAGFFRAATKAMIRYGGPITTRSNDTQEKVLKT
jgi:beta-hydroxylase